MKVEYTAAAILERSSSALSGGLHRRAQVFKLNRFRIFTRL